MKPTEQEQLAGRLRHFGEVEVVGSSELYQHLAPRAAEDSRILEMLTHRRAGQPPGNILFGAVQFLLFQEVAPQHGLRRFYRSLTAHPRPAAEAWPDFQEFCHAHSVQLEKVIRQRLVQTNEVRRCVYLWLVFGEIARQEGGDRPLGLMEIGTSAGLHLALDHYAYRVDETLTFGRAESALELCSSFQGTALPWPVPPAFKVGLRVGADLNVIDLNDSDDALWLEALIWPEHTERRETLLRAVDISKTLPRRLVEGDATTDLPELAAPVPGDEVLVVFHTHVANQFSPEQKRRLRAHLAAISAERGQPVHHVFNNMEDGDLHWETWQAGESKSQRLAQVDGHARWVKWLEGSTV